MQKEYLHASRWDFLHFSPARGNLPVLYSGQFDESEPVDILTNGGAQLMNSELYNRRYYDFVARNIVQHNEWSVAGSMLAYSRPGDRFIFTSNDAIASKNIFSIIADSYEQIEIPVTHNFVPVTHLDNIRPEHPLLPNVISKEVIRHFNDPAIAQPNVTFYRKDHHQQLWQNNNLPTPRTTYISRDSSISFPEAIASLGAYQKYVLNPLDGSGGYNVIFSAHSELLSTINSLYNCQDTDVIQIQGVLPLISSPCIIANLSDQETQIVTASYQRFKKQGVYGGNKWTPHILSELEDYNNIYTEAFENLRKQGVRGQVNIDLLIIDPLYAEYNNTSPVLLREANIRPAGSSVLTRLKEAKINGKPVERIHLSNNIRTKDLQKITAFNCRESNMYAHVYNYFEEQVALAFLGTAEIPEESLMEFEHEIKSNIR